MANINQYKWSFKFIIVKIFLTIFIRIGTFFKNIRKIYIFSQNFSLQMNSEIFWNFSSHNLKRIFKNFLDFNISSEIILIKNLRILRYFIINIYMKNSEKRSNSYKKCEKVIKLYRNSEKLYEKFWEKMTVKFISPRCVRRHNEACKMQIASRILWRSRRTFSIRAQTQSRVRTKAKKKRWP